MDDTSYYTEPYTFNPDAQNRFRRMLIEARAITESKNIEIRGHMADFVTLFDPRWIYSNHEGALLCPSRWFSSPFVEDSAIALGVLEIWVNHPMPYRHTVFSMAGGE
jgi:hypothetical protein